jgi:two-component system nitrate/nitrite response regulator NarP
MDTPFQTLVVDDHPLLRKGIIQLLNSEHDFSVIAEASTGAQALELAIEKEPELILLDLNMKGMSGLDTLRALRDAKLETIIIILTVSDAKQDVIKLINSGADGYLLKDTQPDDLVEQLRQAARGQLVLSDAIRPYLNCLHEIDDFESRLVQLTRRELQTLQVIAQGASNREVASKLRISEGTVKVHVKNLLKKLQAKSRVEMTVMYLEHSSRQP